MLREMGVAFRGWAAGVLSVAVWWWCISPAAVVVPVNGMYYGWSPLPLAVDSYVMGWATNTTIIAWETMTTTTTTTVPNVHLWNAVTQTWTGLDPSVYGLGPGNDPSSSPEARPIIVPLTPGTNESFAVFRFGAFSQYWIFNSLTLQFVGRPFGLGLETSDKIMSAGYRNGSYYFLVWKDYQSVSPAKHIQLHSMLVSDSDNRNGTAVLLHSYSNYRDTAVLYLHRNTINS